MKKDGRKRAKEKKWLLWLLLLLLLGLGGVWYYLNNQSTPTPLASRDLMPDIIDATDRELAERAQEIADADYFTLNLNPEAYFEDGESEGSIQIINPGTNVYPIALELFLEETGELIYESGGILPNQEVTSARLLIPLEAGEYLTRADVHIFDPDTLERLRTTHAQVKVFVNN